MKLVTVEKLEALQREDIKFIDIEDLSYVKSIKSFSAKMAEFLVKNNGVGLSACQVDKFEKFFIIKLDNGSCVIIINPVYYATGTRYKVVEACLSYPDKGFMVKRYRRIQADYWSIDEKNDFLFQRKNYMGDFAEVFQHETDHCYGKTIATIGKEV